MIYKFIMAEKANYSVSALCRALQVSRSGFYDWVHRKEKPSRRETANRLISNLLRRLQKKHRGWYGSRRMIRGLAEEYGIQAGRNRVRRLMRESGTQPRRRRAFRKTTNSNHKWPVAPDPLRRNFVVDAPNKVWMGDSTYVKTQEGWLYLAVILDLFSRRVVGWSMSSSLERRICLDALDMAIRQRQPEPGLIHHSDRGCQYASHDYREKLSEHKILSSMSRNTRKRVPDCWDNAVVESFFGTLKSEAFFNKTHGNREEATMAIFEYIEVYYNRQRQHSAVGYQTPEESEQLYYQLPCTKVS